MEIIQIIVVTALVLSPIFVFLYCIDGVIRPMLKSMRYNLLYITIAEVIILLYILFTLFICHELHLSNFVTEILYGDWLILIMFTIFFAIITAIWWIVFFISLLVKKVT